jgi:hypothetical protein
MRVVVIPHRRIKPLFDAWRRSLGGTAESRDRLAAKLWRDLVKSIVAAKGPPPESSEDRSTDPPTFWCSLPGVGLAQLLVKPDRRVNFFVVERRIVVIDLNFSPGLDG